MNSGFSFTFQHIEEQYAKAQELGYEFCTCAEFVSYKKNGLPEKLVVNRVDVDFSVKKAERLGEMFSRLKIPATFFIRLHAPEYNPLSFENYRVIKNLIKDGHEIGYHSEVIDQAAIWSEDPEECLRRDLDTMNTAYGISVQGVASHGGFTEFNNLDFWKERKPKEFSLLYEAYDKEVDFNLFQEAFYVSDSEWTQWKCYDRGVLVPDDRRSFGEHLEDEHPLIYLLIHSDTYYERHFYE